jgi:phosphate-selective porin OprO/OprP
MTSKEFSKPRVRCAFGRAAWLLLGLVLLCAGSAKAADVAGNAGAGAIVEEEMRSSDAQNDPVEGDIADSAPKVYDSDIEGLVEEDKLPGRTQQNVPDDVLPGADVPVEESPAGKEVPGETKQPGYGWDWETLRFRGRFGVLNFKLGGRVMLESSRLESDSQLDRAYPGFDDDETDFRSSQLALTGSFGDDIYYKIQYEFAGDNNDFRDFYVVFQGVPWLGNVRLGQGQEPNSMETLTSLKFNMFQEKSLMNSLTPQRNLGGMFYDHSEDGKYTWAAGLFYRTEIFEGNNADDGFDLAGRFTTVPVYGNGGDTILHLGLNIARRKYSNELRFRSRPETQLTNIRFVDTGDFDASETLQLGTEIAWDDGPLTLQSEFTYMKVDSSPNRDPEFYSGYVSVGYMLTGEHRPYNRTSATFGRVEPARHFAFGKSGHNGALQVAARWSMIDLEDGMISGGTQNNLTLGLNWFLNSQMRATLNYITGRADSEAEGRFHVLQARFQYEF